MARCVAVPPPMPTSRSEGTSAPCRGSARPSLPGCPPTAPHHRPAPAGWTGGWCSTGRPRSPPTTTPSWSATASSRRSRWSTGPPSPSPGTCVGSGSPQMAWAWCPPTRTGFARRWPPCSTPTLRRGSSASPGPAVPGHWVPRVATGRGRSSWPRSRGRPGRPPKPCTSARGDATNTAPSWASRPRPTPRTFVPSRRPTTTGVPRRSSSTRPGNCARERARTCSSSSTTHS